MFDAFKSIKRPALGTVASIGTLYDARIDAFIPVSLMRTAPPAAAVTTMDIHKSDVRFSNTETYNERFQIMGINAELSASVLAGLVNVEGSGRYLLDKKQSDLVMQASLHYGITTVQESLNLFHNDIRECLAFTKISADLATHVVVETIWGAHSIVTAKRVVTEREDREKVEGEFSASFGKLKVFSVGGSGRLETNTSEEEYAKSFEITVYGDVVANDGLCPVDFPTALKFLSNVPKYVSTANHGKGKPIMYTLLPLSFLKPFYQIEITSEIILKELSVDCLDKFVQLFDDLRTSQEILNGCYAFLQAHSFCVPEEHIVAIDAQLKKMRTIEASIKGRYAGLLKSVRTGKEDAQHLWDLLCDIREKELAEIVIPETAALMEKVEFIELLLSKGAHYVGFNGGSLDVEFVKHPDTDIYAFYFNENNRGTSDAWANNLAMVLQLLNDTNRKSHVVLVDCDACAIVLERPIVQLWRDGCLVTGDVAEEWGILANLNTMRYPADSLDRSEWGKPVRCAPVRIPCPGLNCVSTTKRSWVCMKCRTRVVFSYENKYLYCLCGKCKYDEWDFRCEHSKHGVDYAKYDAIKLLSLLEALDPFDEFNILILGQTGVGKSTWINAFINYLTFASLDEAINAERLEWVIPSAFSVQKKESGRLISVDVKVGFPGPREHSNEGAQSDPDIRSEQDGSRGKSATKSTQVYPVMIGNRMYRLIDTPGIGDTDGSAQDKKNVADILRVLPGYTNLHGILILLKSNQSRLDVIFRFCIKELLIHLHRNAVKNIVFGFTNTRGSSYNPGDTFKPLESLLTKYRGEGVDIALSEDNVYCFDSESFRYLAALKQGEDLGYRKENSESWGYSVKECHRLVQHLEGLPPHKVTSTTNLNEVRRTILQLTEPMAKLSEDIDDTIAANLADIEDLTSKTMEKEELESKLTVQEKVPIGRNVDKPRTVCGHQDCVEYRSQGLYNMRDQTVIYKTVCHDPCYLKSVEVGTMGDRELRHCSATYRTGNCHGAGNTPGCGHSWMQHLHVKYIIESEWVTVTDRSVEEELGKSTNVIDKIAAAIKEKEEFVAHWREEQKTVKQAAARFSLFLRCNCIGVYNDETIEYLEKLIELEKSRMRGASLTRDRVADLVRQRDEYLQEKAILDESFIQNPQGREEVLSPEAVLELMDKLFRLPRYGPYFRQTQQTVARAQQTAYRERPVRVHVGTHWFKDTETQEGDERWRSYGRTAFAFARGLGKNTGKFVTGILKRN